MSKCDDCGRDYPDPVYYTFEPESCVTMRDDEELVHGDCTGNLCPECAGPFLDPDDPDDPRRPQVTAS